MLLRGCRQEIKEAGTEEKQEQGTRTHTRWDEDAEEEWIKGGEAKKRPRPRGKRENLEKEVTVEQRGNDYLELILQLLLNPLSHMAESHLPLP